jgi:hypothetical protein
MDQAGGAMRGRGARDEVGLADRDRHAVRPVVGARLAGMATHRRLDCRLDQRVQPDRRPRRPRHRHCRDCGCRLRRHSDCPRSHGRGHAAHRARRRCHRVPGLQLRAGHNFPWRQRQPVVWIPAGHHRHRRLAERRHRTGHRRASPAVRAPDCRHREHHRPPRRRPAGRRPSFRAAMRQLVEPDRRHIHHHLLARGWSTPRTVLVLYGITALLSLLALSTAQVP